MSQSLIVPIFSCLIEKNEEINGKKNLMYHKGSCFYNLIVAQWSIINYHKKQLNEEIQREYN